VTLSGNFRKDLLDHISSDLSGDFHPERLTLRRKQYSHAFLSLLLSTELDRAFLVGLIVQWSRRDVADDSRVR
jgi:hypothetical protein